MKLICMALAFLLPAAALAAEGPVALGPNGGKFGDWTAATYGKGDAKACYAFVPATHSTPDVHGRGAVSLTVTQRHGAPDEVTLGAGYTFPKDAQVTLTVGSAKFDFYTQGSTAFTTAGKDAVAAFRNGDSAEFVADGPHGKPVTDDFSLKGFGGAYGAISAACP